MKYFFHTSLQKGATYNTAAPRIYNRYWRKLVKLHKSVLFFNIYFFKII